MDNTISASCRLGKTGVTTFIVVMGSVVFRILWLATVFLSFRTVESIYLRYPFSWAITGVAEILYFRYTYRHTFQNGDGKTALQDLAPL